jgi:thiamine-phosphate pyrophosphorylase
MLVTDDRLLAGRDVVSLALAAEAGGADAAQLRLKNAPAREQAALTRALVAALRIPVLVNDRPDVAAGVHLGADDLPVTLARRMAPPGFLIGASVGSDAEAMTAGDADYWGIGPWRVTGTKADAGAGLGEVGFARLARLARGRPCLAIGGVQPTDVPLVRRAGGSGVAVVSGILNDPDVRRSTARYAAAWAPGGQS